MFTKSILLPFIGVILAIFLYVIDVTVVNVAIEDIQNSLHSSYNNIKWIISGYQLGVATILILGAQLSKYFGARRILIIGVISFIATSALCGLAQSTQYLISYRVLQGIAAGLIYSQIPIEIMALFNKRYQGRAFGILGSTIGIALIMGPVIGGLLLKYDIGHIGWRSIFLINLPLGVIALFFLFYKIPNRSKEHREKLSKRSIFNLITSNIIFISCIFLFIFSLNNGQTYHWNNYIKLTLVSSVALGFLFFYYESFLKKKYQKNGLFDINIFKHKSFILSIIMTIMLYLSFGSLFLLLNIYQQLALHRTALYSGVSMIPYAIGMSIGSALSSRYIKHFMQFFFLSGYIFIFSGILMINVMFVSNSNIEPTMLTFASPLFIYGLGIGNILPHLFLMAFGEHQSPTKSGIITTIQQIGFALGVAIIGGIFFTGIGTNVKKQLDYSANKGIEQRLADHHILLPPQELLALKKEFVNCVKNSTSEEGNKNQCSNQSPGVPKEITEVIKEEGQSLINKTFSKSLIESTGTMLAFSSVSIVLVVVFLRNNKRV